MMNYFFPKIFIILYLSFFSFSSVLSDVFIVAKVNQEIITNIDLEFEKKYLTSLNPNLKKLDQNRISDYAKKSRSSANKNCCDALFFQARDACQPPFFKHPSYVVLNVSCF